MEVEKLVKLHWGRQRFEFTVDQTKTCSGLDLKILISALLNIIPENQMVLGFPDGPLSDDHDLTSCDIPHELLVVGASEAAPTSGVKLRFVEDMTSEEANRNVVLIARDKAEVTPVGLHNLGNTCYMNSALQMIRPLFLANHEVFEGISSDFGLKFFNLFEFMQNEASSSYHPSEFVNSFRARHPQFAERGERGGFLQQDAQEFLQLLLADVPEMRQLFDFGSEDLFLQCPVTRDTSHLSEILPHESVSKLPSYLIVHLMRFSFRPDINETVKITKKITIPRELDALPIMVDGELKQQIMNEREENENIKTGKYEFCGIVAHKGRSANSGHYLGYIRKAPKSRTWWYFDDHNVTEMPYNDIKKIFGTPDMPVAYMCLFRHKSQ
ncbi:hypothetical protein PCE1_001603 [Barthelona sp. PCE]